VTLRRRRLQHSLRTPTAVPSSGDRHRDTTRSRSSGREAPYTRNFAPTARHCGGEAYASPKFAADIDLSPRPVPSSMGQDSQLPAVARTPRLTGRRSAQQVPRSPQGAAAWMPAHIHIGRTYVRVGQVSPSQITTWACPHFETLVSKGSSNHVFQRAMNEARELTTAPSSPPQTVTALPDTS
jgi:hypothetical protein